MSAKSAIDNPFKIYTNNLRWVYLKEDLSFKQPVHIFLAPCNSLTFIFHLDWHGDHLVPHMERGHVSAGGCRWQHEFLGPKS